MSSNEDEIMKLINRFTDFFNRFPALWIIYPILFIAPIVLLLALCIRPQQSTRSSVQNGGGKQPSPSSRSKKSSLQNNKTEGVEENDHQISKANSNLNDTGGPTRHIIRRGRPTGSQDDDNRAAVDNNQAEMQWNFPPTLDEFNLMDSDVDPSVLEEMFLDSRLTQVIVRLTHGQGLGVAIVGGRGSSNGDVPIYVKRILPESVLQKDPKIKSGDELIAVNDLILVNTTKEYATEALSNVEGTVRLLLLQEL